MLPAFPLAKIFNRKVGKVRNLKNSSHRSGAFFHVVQVGAILCKPSDRTQRRKTTEPRLLLVHGNSRRVLPASLGLKECMTEKVTLKHRFFLVGASVEQLPQHHGIFLVAAMA